MDDEQNSEKVKIVNDAYHSKTNIAKTGNNPENPYPETYTSPLRRITPNN